MKIRNHEEIEDHASNTSANPHGTKFRGLTIFLNTEGSI